MPWGGFTNLDIKINTSKDQLLVCNSIMKDLRVAGSHSVLWNLAVTILIFTMGYTEVPEHDIYFSSSIVFWGFSSLIFTLWTAVETWMTFKKGNNNLENTRNF